MITLLLIAGVIAAAFMILGGPPRWKKIGAALGLGCVLIGAGLVYLLGSAG